MAALKYPPIPQKIRLSKTAPDPSLGRLWGLATIGFFSVFTPLAQPISKKTKPCSPKVVVAIIDTGMDYTHPELREHLWKNKGEIGFWKPAQGIKTACLDKHCNGIDDDGNGLVDDVIGWDFVNNVPLPFDTHGHGTHISGIIGAKARNGFGIMGVCSNVSIMTLKYYDNSVLGYNNLQNTVRAIDYAVANGAHIINYSGGGSGPAPIEAKAVLSAQKKGILFITAAGNDGRNTDWMPYYPANYKINNIISVGSMNVYRRLLESSNYGPKSVDLAAPGLGILSTVPSGRFGTMSGASQATAFVTGAAALLASQLPKISQFDYLKIKSYLLKSATPLKLSKKYPGPLIKTGVLSLSGALLLEQKALGVIK